MKKLLVAFTLIAGCVQTTFAGPCVALDYQEMKDMSADELLKATCKAGDAMSKSLDETISNGGSGLPPFPNAQENFDQCSGQIDRMLRVLKGKGVSGKLYELCAQQAAGQTIKAPAEAK